MATITKEFVSETYYDFRHVVAVTSQLKNLQIKYVTEPVFSGFHGTKISVVKPHGKGSNKRLAAVLKILE